MKQLALMLMAVALVFTSCETKKHHDKKAKITSYRVPNTTTADPNDWLYYYIIFNDHSNSYYYTSSPIPVTSFSGTSWTTSQTMPTELANQTPIGEIEESLTELPDQIEVELDEVIDVDTDNEADNASDDGDGDASDASGDSDSGSGDSGGDSGGDDGGGGDGGGGE